MDKVLGIGNALVDLLIPLPGDDLLAELQLVKGSMTLIDNDKMDRIFELTDPSERRQASGGSAANTIHGLARLGAETGFMGTVGDDEFGRFFKMDMATQAIAPHLSCGQNETGRSVILISPDSERTMATFIGAAVELKKNDVSESLFKNYQMVHIEGYLVLNKDLVEQALRVAKSLGLRVSIDLASFNVVEDNLDFLQRVVAEEVDVVFANEDEAKALTGLSDPLRAVEAISRMCPIAVVKIGARGSLIQERKSFYKVEPIRATAVDTTGAGDSYAAGFLYGLSRNLSLLDCGRLGSLIAGHVVETVGAKLGDEIWTEINRQVAHLKS